MYLNEHPTKAGYEWFCQGIKLFFSHPLKALSIFLTYIFAMMLFSLVPVLGPLLPLLLLPGLSVGFMHVGRALMTNQAISPLALLTGFRDYGSTVRKHLLMLGLTYIIATLISLALSSLVDGGVLMRLFLGRSQADNQLLMQSGVPGAVLVTIIAYIPIAVLFWFAPTLTAWNNISPRKALFFSAVSCWRNRGAFILYTLLWMGFAVTLSASLAILFRALGLTTLAAIIIMPLSLILTSMFYCSFYITYRSCFGDTAALPATN